MHAERSIIAGLLGEHTAASLTPPMHEAEAKRQGITLAYRALDIAHMRIANPDWADLVRTAQRFGYDGLNVTHPAKQAVLPALDSLSDDAEILGAVNTIVFADGRTRGENTDHSGFTDALTLNAIDASSGTVVQFGAGGAGAAVAYALLRAGAPRISVIDLDRARVEALADRLAVAFDRSRIVAISPEDAPSAVREATGLVNCTPIGMTGVAAGRAPVDLDSLHSRLWVGDAIYRPLRTPLVQHAEALGCATFGGAHMVVGQAVAAFELLTGRVASHEAMLRWFDDAAMAIKA